MAQTKKQYDGKKGGVTTFNKFGSQYMRAIGSKGGKKSAEVRKQRKQEQQSPDMGAGPTDNL